MKKVDIVVVIPAGPGTNFDFISDTIMSYAFYSIRPYQIVMIDDSHEGLGKKVQTAFPDVDVVMNSKASGSMAGLYTSLSKAYKYALCHYEFKLIFKLDTDALVIDEGPEEQALALFESQPYTAMAGQYPYTFEDKPWDLGWPRARIHNGTRTWKFIRRPLVNILLRKLHLRALKNGYRTGESVFGGAYFIGIDFIRALDAAGYLPHPVLGRANLGEDHIFSLLAKSMGFELASLSARDQPFACEWKVLPASPHLLAGIGKKIIHSTRGYGDENEASVRSYFAGRRESVNVKLVQAE